MRALAQLRDLLLGGAFGPGERLFETDLVQRLGVSRSPLRLALTMLEHEGLIELRPTGGHVARAFTAAEVEDLLHVRGVLEGTAARLAAERSRKPPALLAELRASFDAMDAALSAFPAPGVFRRYFEEDSVFSALIVRLAGSPGLKRVLDRAVTVPLAPSGRFAGRQMEQPPLGFLVLMQSHHRGLLDAIERGEGTRAESIAREHWRSFSDGLQHVLRSACQRAPHELAKALPGGANDNDAGTSSSAPR
jgi:GntR family transcriptional regulator of vanillate catabolism